jgi:hypothetical protein
MTVLEYLESTYTGDRFTTRDRVTCKDGFSISVQGGTEFHYCRPRELCNEYQELELGFPSEADNLISSYAENKDYPTHTVYGYVPIEVVEELIFKHGGIV